VTPVSDLIAVEHTDLYIGGAWVKASDSQRIEVHDPASGEVIATVASATLDDARAAVDAAAQAGPDWSGRPPRERAEILRRTFELMLRDREKLAELMVRENGKPMAEARAEAVYAAEFFRWFSEEAVRNIGSLSIAPSGQNRILVIHQPIGLSLLVTPWNFPAAMATRKIAPALAAGCTLVLKPASETPLTALAQAMGRMPVGSGLDPEVKVGPVINQPAREKIAGLVERAVDHGARVVTGGKAPSRPGYFYQPTVLADVPPDEAILAEEIFGPV